MLSNSPYRYQPSQNERYAAQAALALMATMWLTVLFNYFSLDCEPGLKFFVLFFPAASTFVTVFYALLLRVPHKGRYKTPITEANAQEEFGKRVRLLLVVNVCSSAAGLLLTLKVIEHAKGHPQAFGVGYPLLTFLAMLPALIYFIRYSYKYYR